MKHPSKKIVSKVVFFGGLFFCSGLAALLLQTLWLRDLGRLLGNTATAAAVVLGVFFLGLALGGLWARRGRFPGPPLRNYALLEAATAAFALLFLLLEKLFVFLYDPLITLTGRSPLLFAPAAFLIVLPLLLPATVCMGATLPIISEYIQKKNDTGRRIAFVYAANVLGGGAGVLLGAFYLPQSLGYSGAYYTAVTLVAAVAALAYVYDRAPGTDETAANDERAAGEGLTSKKRSAANADSPGGAKFDRTAPVLIAFLSGFVTLACEIFWMHLFARVLQNSTYTYAVVLFAVLLGLGAGSLAAARWNRALANARGLVIVMIGATLLIALSPLLVYYATDGLAYFGGDADWSLYLFKIFGLAGLTLFPASLLLGLILPLLFSLPGAARDSWRKSLGGLLAINTIGSIAGSVLAGFVLLPWLGLFGGIRFVALLYPAGLLILLGRSPGVLDRRIVFALAAAVLLPVSLFDPGRLPAVRLSPLKGESLLEAREGPRGQAAVVLKRNDLRIKLDNHYTIGGSAARAAEERQAHLPMLLHPAPRRVFVLGLGTGITAGAVLRHGVEHLRVAELVPEIVELSRRHFSPYTGGLFKDERARVIIADGRWLLRSSRNTYDVVLADLFTPWKTGAGDLYNREHFETVRERLAPNGIFAQWLPLFQMTEYEFSVVARTMLEVFPRVTLWRGDFFTDRNIVALVGHRDGAPLDPGPARRRLERARGDERDRLRELAPALAVLRARRDARTEALSSLLMYYAGDLTARKKDFAKYPLATDDRPVVVWQAPVSNRRVRTGSAGWIAGETLLLQFDRTFAFAPPAEDDYLRRLSAAEKRYARAGLAMHRLVLLNADGNKEAALEELKILKKLLGAGE